MTLRETLAKAEKEALVYALVTNECKIAKTATALGISRKNLWEKMKKYEIFTEFLITTKNEKAA